MVNEDNHPELQPNLNMIQIAEANLKSVLVRLSQRLTTLDGVEYQDYGLSDKNRLLKRQINNLLRSWDNTLDKQKLDHINAIMEQLEAAHENSLIVRRVHPYDDTEMTPLLGIQPSSHAVHVEAWAKHSLIQRRQKQIQKENFVYDRDEGIFLVDVPAAYRCKTCLTNDHALAECVATVPICLKCKRRGHVAGYCQWQLCAWCKIYGHGRQKCQSTLSSPACYKCGIPGHDPNTCEKKQIFCRLCGGSHTTNECEEYFRLGEPCFKHCGYHKYDDCPSRFR